MHLAVDTLSHVLAVYATAVSESDRAQVTELAQQVQGVTGGTIQVAFVIQAAADAASQDIRLELVKLPNAKHGFFRLGSSSA